MRIECMVGVFVCGDFIAELGEVWEWDAADLEALEKVSDAWRYALRCDWIGGISGANASEAKRLIALCDDAADIACLTDCETRAGVQRALHARLDVLDPYELP